MEDRFKTFWKKLTQPELKNIRRQIKDLQDKGVRPSIIESRVQGKRKKLKEDWKAEQVYRTESNRIRSEEVRQKGEKLGIGHYKILLEPNACPLCQKVSGNEKKIFTADQLKKKKDIVPYMTHPNCRCQLVMYNPMSKSWNPVI